MTIRDIAIAFGYEIDSNSEKKVNESINKLKTTAGKVLGAIGIGFSLSQINALVEQYGAINQRLKSTTGELANQKELQDKIMQSASKTLTSYETTASAVSSYLSQSKKVLKTSESAVQFTELATKAWKAAGKEEAQIASLHSTLASAFQKNIIDAGTFETILAQSPETIGYLEKSLGKTRTQLRAMATAGVLTASHLTEAFTNSADEINSAFANAPMRISDALKIAKEKVALVLTQTDEGMKITTEISKQIVKGTDFLLKGLQKIMGWFTKLTDRLGGTQNLLKLIGIGISAIASVKAIAKIKTLTSVIDSLRKIFSVTNLKIVATVAAIMLLFLLIEDFIAFLNGKNSVFGDLLKKMGLDPDEVRNTINGFIDSIKTGLGKITGVFKGIGSIGDVIQKVTGFFKEHEGALGLVAIAVGTLAVAVLAYNFAQKQTLGGLLAKIALWAIEKAATIASTVATVAHTVATTAAATATTAFGAAMAFLTSPITLVILAIGALIAIVYLLWKNWDKISAWFKKTFDKFKTWWDDFKKSTAEKVNSIKESIGSAFQKVLDWFKSNWKSLLLLLINPFAGALSLLYNNNEKFRNAVDNLLNKIREKFGEFKQKLKDKVAEWKTGIEEGFESVKTWFEELPGKALQWGRDMLDNFISGILEKFPGLQGAIDKITEFIKGVLGHSVPTDGPLKDDDKWMPDFMENLSGGIKKNLPKLKASVGDIVSTLLVFANPQASDVTQNISQGATSQRIVNQYNNWTNHFNGGTKQEQADLAKASDSQVAQASHNLGRELAYTR